MANEHPTVKSKRRRANGLDTRRLTVHLPTKLYTQLRQVCVNEDWSFSFGVELAIHRMLRAHEKQRQRASAENE